MKFVFNENRSKNVYTQSCTKPTNERNLSVNCLHVAAIMYGKKSKHCRFQIKNANQNMANAIDFHMNSQSICFSLAISIKCWLFDLHFIWKVRHWFGFRVSNTCSCSQYDWFFFWMLFASRLLLLLNRPISNLIDFQNYCFRIWERIKCKGD